MARFHADRPEVRTVVARLFNTYGPRETNPHVLPAIMAAMHAGQPIELGNLWPQRDLHLRDRHREGDRRHGLWAWFRRIQRRNGHRDHRR